MGGVLAVIFGSAAMWGQTSQQQSTQQQQSSPQQQSSQPQQQQTQQQQTPQQKQQQATPPEAGGPTGDVGPIALPKKKEDEAPAPARPKPVPSQTPTFSMSLDVPLVTLDVSVLTKDQHQFVPGLKKDNFKVFEDGVEQNVSQFGQTGEAPITAVLLVEFPHANNAAVWEVTIDALKASYTFAQSLKKDDWIAVVSYDLRSKILSDFTQDKRQVYAALGQLRPETAGFSETDVFDALYDTIDRLEGIQGRKYIILVSTGRDTFSKMNLDKTLAKIKSAKDITIYSIGLGTALRYMGYTRYLCPEATLQCSEIEFLQADNQLDTFARLTGGRSYHPKFDGEFPEIFNDIAADIRNEYILAYRPTNAKMDGTYRKLQVKVVAPDGQPLKVKNEKGKDVKIEVVAREGYNAKHEVE